MKPPLCLAILYLVLAAAPALADDGCDVPVQQWQSREAVLRHAASQGWQVQRLKIYNGCYEIRGRDAEGRAFKARLDPQTLRVVNMKLRGGNGDHDREHEHRRERQRTRDAPAPANASPEPPPGTTPRGQIE